MLRLGVCFRVFFWVKLIVFIFGCENIVVVIRL